MILYKKNGDFIGMGKEELSFLGFEDMEQFKEKFNDVADLFVNKPGFIYKFKNFSWIDYTLNSGAPKKSVILKLRNGTEIESTLKIKEIFLYDVKDDESICYAVEFKNTLMNESTTKTNLSEPLIIREAEEKIEKHDFAINTEEKIEKHDFAINTEEKQASVSFDEDIEDYKPQELVVKEPELKLKMDTPFINESKEPKNNIIEEDYNPIIKIKNDVIEPILSPKKEITIETFSFDVLECADKLGLNISLIAEVLNDYIENIDKTIPQIKYYVDTNDDKSLQNSIYSLKGISDNLGIAPLSKQLTNILHAADRESKLEEVEKFKIVVKHFKEELK